MAIKKMNGLNIIDTTRGQPNGIASLNAQGRVPSAELPIPYGSDLYLSKTTPSQYFSTWLDDLSNFSVTWKTYTVPTTLAVSKVLPITETKILCSHQNGTVSVYDLETEEQTRIITYNKASYAPDLYYFYGVYYVVSNNASSTAYKEHVILMTTDGVTWDKLYEGTADVRIRIERNAYLYIKIDNVVTIYNAQHTVIHTLEGIGYGAIGCDGTHLCYIQNNVLHILVGQQERTVDISTLSFGNQIAAVFNGYVVVKSRDEAAFIRISDGLYSKVHWGGSLLYGTTCVMSSFGAFTAYVDGYNSPWMLFRIGMTPFTRQANYEVLASGLAYYPGLELYANGDLLFRKDTTGLYIWVHNNFVRIRDALPYLSQNFGAVRNLCCYVGTIRGSYSVVVGKFPAIF